MHKAGLYIAMCCGLAKNFVKNFVKSGKRGGGWSGEDGIDGMCLVKC